MIGRISVKSSRTKGHSVTLRIRRDKKRGHDHKMVEQKNLKQQVVMRCKVCKHHYIFLILKKGKIILRGIYTMIGKGTSSAMINVLFSGVGRARLNLPFILRV